MNHCQPIIDNDLTLDAGAVEETADHFTVHPPDTPMIDQLIAYLEDKTYHYSGIQTRHMGIGLSALCVRWGSYLATLMDANTELHPAIPGFHKEQPDEYSFISNGEMKRLNIEISHNVCRIVQFRRERGEHDLWNLLTKARDYLPMPHKQMPQNRQTTQAIQSGLAAGAVIMAKHSNESRELFGLPPIDESEARLSLVAVENADRVLANTLTCQIWRSTVIEEIHGGKTPEEGLKPHQQRFNRRKQLAVMREVTANLGSVLYTMDLLFDINYEYGNLLPVWPHTATAMANSFYGTSASGWSVIDASSPVTLRK